MEVQVQRVETCCILIEGILTRQLELHTRTAEVVANLVAMDNSLSPSRGLHGALDWEDDSEQKVHDSTVGGAGPCGGGFVPSLGVIDQTFFFAMVWGLGGGLTGDPALAFDVYVRDLLQVSPVCGCVNANISETNAV